MTQYPYLDAWLRCLMQVSAPNGLVHIGAGGSGATAYPFLSVPRLLLVEAEARRFDHLQGQLKNHGDCQLVHEVVAGQAGAVDFHALSLPNESGLCSSEALRPLWRNIKSLRTSRCTATTLGDLIESASVGAHFDWVIIDCLPAGQLLQGAGALPAQWNVLVVRALQKTAGDALTESLADLASVCRLAGQFGLELLALEEENHAEIVHAVFARNYAAQAKMTAASAREQAAATVAAVTAAAAAEREQAAATVAAVTAAAAVEREQAAHERLQLSGENAMLVAQVASLQEQCDEQKRTISLLEQVIHTDFQNAQAQIVAIEDLLIRNSETPTT